MSYNAPVEFILRHVIIPNSLLRSHVLLYQLYSKSYLISTRKSIPFCLFFSWEREREDGSPNSDFQPNSLLQKKVYNVAHNWSSMIKTYKPTSKYQHESPHLTIQKRQKLLKTQDTRSIFPWSWVRKQSKQ